MKRKFLLIYCWLVRILLYFLPDIPLVMRFRGWLYGLGMKKCGCDFQVTHDAIIRELHNITIGNHCFVGNGVIMMGSGKINIGNDVMIAPHSVIVSGNHTSKDGSYKKGRIDTGIITLKDGTWVASNCTIVKNSALPEDSVLCANSFLNKDFSLPHSIYGGVPAKHIKTRDDILN